MSSTTLIASNGQALNIGDAPKLWFAYRDATGALADVATLMLWLKTPSGVITTYTLAAAQIVRDSLGTYYYVLSITESGTWFGRWTAPQLVEQFTFTVDANLHRSV